MRIVVPVKIKKQVKAWNDAHQPGAPVEVSRDSGTLLQTVTAGAAFLTESGHPVIMVQGISGYYLLDRVKPAKRDGTGAVLVDDRLYYVQDKRSTVGNCVLWWCPNGNGYTCDIDNAGTYTGSYVRGLRDTDIGWPVDVVLASVQRFVDWQKLRSTAEARAALPATTAEATHA